VLPGQRAGTHIITQVPTKSVSVAWKAQATADNAILMRFNPLPTVSASFTTSGSSGTFSAVHSQNEAVSAARSTESLELQQARLDAGNQGCGVSQTVDLRG
jgi:hypothetical protein